MHKTLIECDPVTDRIIWTGIQRERAILRRQQQHRARAPRPASTASRVDALASAVTNTGTVTGRAEHAIVVHIDRSAHSPRPTRRHVCRDRHRHRRSRSRSPGGIACDADIIPVVLDGRGVVLDEGRAKRLATFEQRIAIQAMQTTCSHPDCTVTIDDCRIHHSNPSVRGGRDRSRIDLAPVVRTTPPPRPRRRLDTHPDPRPGRDVDPPRRHHLLDRASQRSASGLKRCDPCVRGGPVMHRPACHRGAARR